MFFLRPELLWYFTCLFTSDRIQEALPQLLKSSRKLGDVGHPVTGRARFQQSVGGKQGL